MPEFPSEREIPGLDKFGAAAADAKTALPSDLAGT
jgi:hypothetical protein